MRIAIHDYAGFSFPLELSRALSKKGHEVFHFLTPASGGPKASLKTGSEKSFSVVEITNHNIDKDNLLKRWYQERRYGNLAVKMLNKYRPQVVVSGNTPLVAQTKIMNWAAENAIPSIFWLHDLLSVAALSVLSPISPVLARLAYAYFNRLEVGTLSKADHIVSVTEDFFPYLHRWQIDFTKISVIPNWGPIELIPVLPRINRFSLQYGLTDKFVVLYSGTLGKKQSIHLIADTAAKLADVADILFVVATDERGHQLLKQQMGGKKLPNLLQLPLQPTSLYPYLLASADVTLVTLEKAAGRYCVPSKLWSSYCAKKPSIVAVDRNNQSALTTDAIQAGVVISPGSIQECAGAIERLKCDNSKRMQMGINARQYAERHFPISAITDKFEAIIHQITIANEGQDLLN